MRPFLLAALAFGLAAPAFAEDAVPAPAKEQKAEAGKKAEDPNRMVCTREHVVGSNRPQKVCLTVAQRQQLKDEADRTMDPSRRTSGRGTETPSGL
jgi:hypothetical protein